MSPTDLAQRLMDLPGSVEVVDLRPAWQIKEFAIAGATSASVPDVMSNPGYLVGKRPLVLVCRDGSVSAAVGGALAGKTDRSIRYVDGGITRYWNDVMRPRGIYTDRMPAGPAAAAPEAAAPRAPAPAAPQAPAPAPKKSKRPSAGC